LIYFTSLFAEASLAQWTGCTWVKRRIDSLTENVLHTNFS